MLNLHFAYCYWLGKKNTKCIGRALKENQKKRVSFLSVGSFCLAVRKRIFCLFSPQTDYLKLGMTFWQRSFSVPLPAVCCFKMSPEIVRRRLGSRTSISISTCTLVRPFTEAESDAGVCTQILWISIFRSFPFFLFLPIFSCSFSALQRATTAVHLGSSSVGVRQAFTGFCWGGTKTVC